MAESAEVVGESFLPMSQDDANECEQRFQQGGMMACQDFLRQKLEDWKNVPLTIGVIGYVKTGKSSFINAIRGLTGDDEGAAPVGVVETTMEPMDYAHPNNPNFKFWDLPGVGTPNYPQENYLELVGFAEYDFFLIISSETFTVLDKWLAEEIAKGKKQYFFVRTKIDQNIRNDVLDHPRTHNRENVLADVHNNIKTHIGDRYDRNKVFLIDNHLRQEYDFNKLEECLIQNFPSLKRDALILSMSSLSKGMVQEKVKVLRRLIWPACLLSAGVAAVPIPGLSIVADLGLILAESTHFFHQLGLDDASLEKMARIMKCDVTCLKQIVSSDWKRWLTIQGIKDLIVKVPLAVTATIAEEWARLIPFLGSIIAAPMSFCTTYAILNGILTKMESLALLVLEAVVRNGSTECS